MKITQTVNHLFKKLMIDTLSNLSTFYFRNPINFDSEIGSGLGRSMNLDLKIMKSCLIEAHQEH